MGGGPVPQPSRGACRTERHTAPAVRCRCAGWLWQPGRLWPGQGGLPGLGVGDLQDKQPFSAACSPLRGGLQPGPQPSRRKAEPTPGRMAEGHCWELFQRGLGEPGDPHFSGLAGLWPAPRLEEAKGCCLLSLSSHIPTRVPVFPTTWLLGTLMPGGGEFPTWGGGGALGSRGKVDGGQRGSAGSPGLSTAPPHSPRAPGRGCCLFKSLRALLGADGQAGRGPLSFVWLRTKEGASWGGGGCSRWEGWAVPLPLLSQCPCPPQGGEGCSLGFCLPSGDCGPPQHPQSGEAPPQPQPTPWTRPRDSLSPGPKLLLPVPAPSAPGLH